VAGSSVAGDVIQIGDVTGNVTVLLERSSFRLELLHPVAHVDLPERVRRQPSYLLHPNNQVVPYRRPVDDLATPGWATAATRVPSQAPNRGLGWARNRGSGPRRAAGDRRFPR
jgi:hypothetical protein